VGRKIKIKATHTYRWGDGRASLGKKKKAPRNGEEWGEEEKKNKKEEKRRLPWALFPPPLGPFALRDFFARAVMTDGWGRFLSPLCFFPFTLPFSSSSFQGLFPFSRRYAPPPTSA
jgi:hypothetical protein